MSARWLFTITLLAVSRVHYSALAAPGDAMMVDAAMGARERFYTTTQMMARRNKPRAVGVNRRADEASGASKNKDSTSPAPPVDAAQDTPPTATATFVPEVSDISLPNDDSPVQTTKAADPTDLPSAAVVSAPPPEPQQANNDQPKPEENGASKPAPPAPQQESFCGGSGLPLGDGSQIRGGFCSATVQGQIPSVDKMVSTLIVKPSYDAKLDPQKDFTVEIVVNNMETGFFDDPQSLYYRTPQTLNSAGIIQGHQHISIQELSARGLASAPDAATVAFFQGINEGGQILSVRVPAGTISNNGVYRICSITGTRGHQPVVMPVARRGAQDDCIRVRIEAGAGDIENA
ncbi:hypothetical protein HK102_006724, partial [Quaeritorhiza haematococci]